MKDGFCHFRHIFIQVVTSLLSLCNFSAQFVYSAKGLVLQLALFVQVCVKYTKVVVRSKYIGLCEKYNNMYHYVQVAKSKH